MINLHKYAFFFDFDGTLVDIVPNYKNIIIPGDLENLLNQLYIKCNGAVTIITGRSISNITNYLNTNLPIAGLHGSEYLENGKVKTQALSKNFEKAKQYIKDMASPTLLVEDKHLNIAIHYNNSSKKLAIVLCQEALEKFQLIDYHIQFSRNVVELKLKNFSKATAFRHFMDKSPFKNRIPICFGDDITDEDMFGEALQYDGVAFQVTSTPPVNLKKNWPVIGSTAQLRQYLKHLLIEAQ